MSLSELRSSGASRNSPASSFKYHNRTLTQTLDRIVSKATLTDSTIVIPTPSLYIAEYQLRIGMHSLYEQLPHILDAGEPFAMGIISGIKGSSPQKQGAKALFFGDGRIIGTMGGGCLEAEIQDRARRALRSGQAATFDLILDHDFGWDDGLICGGKVEGVILPQAAHAETLWRDLAKRREFIHWGVRPDFSIARRNRDRDNEKEWIYEEHVSPPCHLWIAGSGHVAQAVAPIAQQLDFEVTVFDDRPSLANHRFFPDPTKFRVDYWNKLLDEPFPDRPVFGLIVTRGHQHDALVLKSWINRPFAFLGMIGSGRKKRIIFEKFMQDGYATQERLDEVSCPVGLDIQAVSVPEIAVSIAAQLVEKRACFLGEPQPKASASLQPATQIVGR